MSQLLPLHFPKDNRPETMRAWIQAQLQEWPKEKEISNQWYRWILEDFAPKNDLAWNASELLSVFEALQRLKNGEPYAYVCGNAPFLHLLLSVNNNVLIPRPETEEWVSQMLSEQPNSPKHFLDVGTGSGCIALAAASTKKNWTVTAVDICPHALATAAKNANQLGLAEVRFQLMDLNNRASWPKDSFDLICSNPPYIPENQWSFAEASVKNFEPHLALFTPKNDPLWYYRMLLNLSNDHLMDEGWLYVETDHTYHQDCLSLLQDCAFLQNIAGNMDYKGNFRWIKAQKMNTP